MLTLDNTALILIDVQGRLASLMHEREHLVRNLRILIEAAGILELPIHWLEQYPKGLGPTIPEVAELLADNNQPFEKTSFSACGQPDFAEALKTGGRRQLLLAGIEAHVCVCQSARDLLGLGYEVEFVVDAISSRTAANKQIGIDKMIRAGAAPTSVETALFELMRTADMPCFKEVSRLVR